MWNTRALLIPFVVYTIQVSGACRYDAYRNSIESPRQFGFPSRMIWAQKERNVDDYQMEKYSSKLAEANLPQLNNTIHATMKQESSEEHHKYFSGDSNSFLELLKQNASETKLHTYQYPHSNTGNGEILVHRPAPIIVKRPPTKVLINHAPLIVKPSPVIFHRPPPVVRRPVFVKHLPQKIRVEPMYVKMVKPTKKVIVKENSRSHEDSMFENEYYNQRRAFNNHY